MPLDGVHQTEEQRHDAGHDENVLETRPHTGIHAPNTIPLLQALRKRTRQAGRVPDSREVSAVGTRAEGQQRFGCELWL